MRLSPPSWAKGGVGSGCDTAGKGNPGAAGTTSNAEVRGSQSGSSTTSVTPVSVWDKLGRVVPEGLVAEWPQGE